jgi:hypothetical protein
VEVDAMKRSVVLLAVIAALAASAAGRFAAQEQKPSVEERINRLTESTARLAAALKKSEASLAALARQVKANAEAHDYLARAIQVDAYGVVRIRGNVRLENNVLEDVTVVNCDEDGTLTRRGGCTCPEGLIAIGIELRPQGVSAYPGPATHNTALICGRL